MKESTKQVLVVRTDLNMRKGKMSAQCAHASMKVFFDRMEDIKSDDDNGYHSYVGKFNEAMCEWMEGSFKKIVVGCNSEEELFSLKRQADEMGIVNAIILDSGQTEFKKECPSCKGKGCDECDGTGKVNNPTYTVLAIGADYESRIDKITKDLKLL